MTQGPNITFDITKEFRTFQVRQRTLADILSEAATVTESLNMSKEQELSALSEKIARDTFKVMVTGTFKNGKSTFINSLLGEEVLPAYALPCTAVINEVKYGEEKQARLYFRNPLPDPLPKRLAPKALSHMSRYKGKPIPPLDIPYDEIEDYVVIPMDEDPKEMKLQSPYAKVELFYPLELLKSGVEIIDSPGLNEDETRTRVTMEYLSSVDAILYVLDANKIASGDEMKFVENDLRGNDFEHVIFVVNRIDQIRERERPQIHKYAFMKLQAAYPNPSLYSVSALNALDGKLDGDADKVRTSGIPELEQRLTDFLTREKGKAKLVQPAKRLRQILSREALEKVIPKERNLLKSSLEDLEKCSREIEPKLKLLRQEKDSKSHKLSSKIARSGKHFERMARTNMSELMKSIPSWVDGFQPQTRLGFLPTRKKTEMVLSEMTDFLKEKLDEHQRDWKDEILQPEIENAFQDIFESAEKDFSAIFEEIDQINMTLSGRQDYTVNPVPFWQRVAGVAGGFMIGGVGLAAVGGINGIGKEFVAALAFEIGAVALLGLLGLLNPFTIGAMIIAVFLGGIGAGSHRALETLKTAFCQNVMDEIAKNADSQSAELADSIEDKLNGLADQIVSAVSNEINDLQRQLDAAMEEKKRGDADVQKRQEELDTIEVKIHNLNSRLDELTFELASQ